LDNRDLPSLTFKKYLQIILGYFAELVLMYVWNCKSEIIVDVNFSASFFVKPNY